MRPIDADALMAKVQEWLNYVSAQTVEVGETDCETVCEPDPYYVGEENVLNMVMRTLRGMPTVDDWISVKEQQPDSDGIYLARLSDGTYRILYYAMNLHAFDEVAFPEDGPGWCEFIEYAYFEATDVTHWRLLPEPPKEPLDVERIIPKPKWMLDRLHHYKCSACGAQWGLALNMNYCPTCGRHMEGRDPDDWRYAQDAEPPEEES